MSLVIDISAVLNRHWAFFAQEVHINEFGRGHSSILCTHSYQHEDQPGRNASAHEDPKDEQFTILGGSISTGHSAPAKVAT